MSHACRDTMSHDAMPRTEVEYLLRDALKRAGRLPKKGREAGRLAGAFLLPCQSFREEAFGRRRLAKRRRRAIWRCRTGFFAILLCSLSALQSALQLEMMCHLKHADIEGSWHGPAERGQMVPTLGT